MHATPFALAYVLILLVTFGLSLIFTPLMTFVSKRIGAVDEPNARRINQKVMPSAGGLAIFLAFVIGGLVCLPQIVSPTDLKLPGLPYWRYLLPFVMASGVIVITGLIDDIKELGAKSKLFGMFVAASMVWFLTHARLDNFKIPFGGPLLTFSPWLSYVLTVFWILAITNAVNLIDGLDGLASGVSVISLTTMGITAYFFLDLPNIYLPLTIFVLVAAIMGFLPYNFNPAIIFLGDTGALFLGFMIAVLSLQGLKYATAVAVLTPMLILGVPLTDTVVAMIRRKLNRQKISSADRMHLHHRLLSLGLTHRGTVLVIYGIAMIFAFLSILLNVSSRLGGILLLIACVFGLEIFVELVGILGKDRTPLLNVLKFIGNSQYREEVLNHRK